MKPYKQTGLSLPPRPLPQPTLWFQNSARLKERGSFRPGWPAPAPSGPPASPCPAPRAPLSQPPAQVGAVPTAPPQAATSLCPLWPMGQVAQRGLLTGSTAVVYAHQASILPLESSMACPALWNPCPTWPLSVVDPRPSHHFPCPLAAGRGQGRTMPGWEVVPLRGSCFSRPAAWGVGVPEPGAPDEAKRGEKRGPRRRALLASASQTWASITGTGVLTEGELPARD